MEGSKIERDLNLGDYFEETPLGIGAVQFAPYLKALAEIGYYGFLTIEREVGGSRNATSASRLSI